MSWPIPDFTKLFVPPKKINVGRWIGFYLFVILFIGILFFFLWSGQEVMLDKLYWLLVIGVSTIISAIVISLRLYLYCLAQEAFVIETQEKARLEQDWQNWALRSIRILNSYYKAPVAVTSAKILTQLADLKTNVHKSNAFNDDEIPDIFSELLTVFKTSLLPLTISETIPIHIYSSTQSYPFIEQQFQTICSKVNFNYSYDLNHTMLDYVDIEQLTHFVDTPESDLKIVIINNGFSSETPFISGFILVNEDYQSLTAKDMQCQLLRPMKTADLMLGLRQLASLQMPILEAKQIWLSNLTAAQSKDVAISLVDNNILIDESYTLDNLFGNQNDISYWLSLALACEMVAQSKQHNLITTISQNQWLFSVVTTMEGKS